MIQTIVEVQRRRRWRRDEKGKEGVDGVLFMIECGVWVDPV